jgi:competence protein ComEC
MFPSLVKRFRRIPLREVKGAYASFWGRNPALFIGLSLLLGTAMAFRKDALLAALFGALSFTARSKSQWILAIVCFLSAFFWSAHLHPKIFLPQEKIHGTGIFHIQQLKTYSSPFNRSLLYAGKLHRFTADDGQIFDDLPCNVYFPIFGLHPSADTDYRISGFLSQKGDYAFVLKPDKKSLWEKVSSPINLSEWRFSAKKTVSEYLKREIPDARSRTFLNALATGEIDERILSMEFGKVGLQHILAISGFHFALAALFLNFLFRLLFPYKVSACLLIASLTFYYLFLGNAPSILRAYIAISMIAAGQIFSWHISGLNALGAGLIVELALGPLVVTGLSFQLTFLCTLAILLFYPAVHRAMKYLLPERSYAEVSAMPFLDKHGYFLSAILRRSLALNFAVHLISLPVLLHLFHKFPLLSIAYNLFFPVCVSLSMLLLFAALFFAPWIPFLSHAIHSINNAWTSSILTMTSNPPAFLDFSFRTKQISFSFILCFLAASLFLGILFYEKERTTS